MRYDASTKYLVEHYLADWLALTPRRATGPAHLIDADLSTVTAQADKVLRVEDPVPWLFHLELQASRDDSLVRRLAWYNALLEYRHDCLVQSAVILLRRQADAPKLTGEVTRQFAGEPPYRTFRYQVVRVWQSPVQSFLTGGLGLLPLAPLSDEAANALPEVLDRIQDRIEHDSPDFATAGSLWTATRVLMGLRYDANVLSLLPRKALTMQESTTYQAIVQEGFEKGIAKGREQGLENGLRFAILQMGPVTLGHPDVATLSQLDAINDVPRLKRLCERLKTVKSWQELLSA